MTAGRRGSVGGLPRSRARSGPVVRRAEGSLASDVRAAPRAPWRGASVTEGVARRLRSCFPGPGLPPPTPDPGGLSAPMPFRACARPGPEPCLIPGAARPRPEAEAGGEPRSRAEAVQGARGSFCRCQARAGALGRKVRILLLRRRCFRCYYGCWL